MSLTAWAVLGILALFVVVLVVCSIVLERKQIEWERLHPPDDDGISLLEDIEHEDSRKRP